MRNDSKAQETPPSTPTHTHRIFNQKGRQRGAGRTPSGARGRGPNGEQQPQAHPPRHTHAPGMCSAKRSSSAMMALPRATSSSSPRPQREPSARKRDIGGGACKAVTGNAERGAGWGRAVRTGTSSRAEGPSAEAARCPRQRLGAPVTTAMPLTIHNTWGVRGHGSQEARAGGPLGQGTSMKEGEGTPAQAYSNPSAPARLPTVAHSHELTSARE
jgi:hypothetical protein